MSTVADLPASMPWPAYLMNDPGGSGSASFTRDSTRRRETLTFLVPFDAREEFLEVCFDLEETITVSPGPPPATITRVVPLLYPFGDPDRPLYALSASGRPVAGGPDDTISATKPWKGWLTTVEFGTLEYSFTDRPFVSVRGAGRSSVMSAPTGSLSILETGEVIDLPPGIPVYQDDLIVTYHEVTDLAAVLGVLQPLAGSVSSDDVTVGGRTYLAGSLLLPEINWEQAISVGGSRKAQVSFPVSWRPRPNWLQVITRAGGIGTVDPPVLQTADLGPIFG